MESKTPLYNLILINRKQRIIFHLLLSGKNYEFSFTDLENALGFNNPQPDLRIFLKELTEQEIIVFSSKLRNGYNLYKVDLKKLKNLFEESELGKLSNKYWWKRIP